MMRHSSFMKVQVPYVKETPYSSSITPAHRFLTANSPENMDTILMLTTATMPRYL